MTSDRRNKGDPHRKTYIIGTAILWNRSRQSKERDVYVRDQVPSNSLWKETSQRVWWIRVCPTRRHIKTVKHANPRTVRIHIPIMVWIRGLMTSTWYLLPKNFHISPWHQRSFLRQEDHPSQWLGTSNHRTTLLLVFPNFCSMITLHTALVSSPGIVRIFYKKVSSICISVPVFTYSISNPDIGKVKQNFEIFEIRPLHICLVESIVLPMTYEN